MRTGPSIAGGTVGGCPVCNVVASPGRLAELAGAVDRVDDPNALGGESGRVVSALFRQDGIVWPASDKQLH
jgi:hypothetical protein